MYWPFLTLKLGRNTTRRRSLTSGSRLTTSATALIALINQLGHPVTGGAALPPKMKVRGTHVDVRIVLDPVVQRDDVQQIQVLALVFVNAP